MFLLGSQYRRLLKTGESWWFRDRRVLMVGKYSEITSQGRVVLLSSTMAILKRSLMQKETRFLLSLICLKLKMMVTIVRGAILRVKTKTCNPILELDRNENHGQTETRRMRVVRMRIDHGNGEEATQ
jgi:hypothetical protein